ncbi:MAG: glycosyltransferase [Saprospirales bacterium]|nr:glycosyltransferase [Saprospirales bacterium]
MFSTPILLIVYNRPDYTIKLLEAIKAIKPSVIYIAADGPKNEADKILIDKTRAVFNAIDWQCTLKTYYREQNEGCGVGVSNGIDWFFSQVEYGIILEDDCIPAPSFFSFTEHLLIKYKENETVMMIGGSSWLDKISNIKMIIFSQI